MMADSLGGRPSRCDRTAINQSIIDNQCLETGYWQNVRSARLLAHVEGEPGVMFAGRSRRKQELPAEMVGKITKTGANLFGGDDANSPVRRMT